MNKNISNKEALSLDLYTRIYSSSWAHDSSQVGGPWPPTIFLYFSWCILLIIGIPVYSRTETSDIVNIILFFIMKGVDNNL